MEFVVLGSLQVIVDGRRVTIPRPRGRAILAFLLLSANRTVSISRIVDAIWASAPPTTARAQVHADISAIRRAIRDAGGSDPIVTSTAGYEVVVEPGCLDIHAFAEKVSRAHAAISVSDFNQAMALLADALALWRGPALADVTAAYVQAARSRLDEQRLDVAELLAELRLSSGDDEGVLDSLRVLIDERPLRERPRVLLMLALYRRGRRSDALQVARDLRRLLVDHEGLDPGSEVRELETKILRGDPSLMRGVDEHTRNRPRPRGLAAPAQLPSPVTWFTGRAERLKQMDSILDEGIDPAFSTVVAVTGLAGIGKTSLAIQWAHSVRDRFPDGQLFADMRGHAEVPPAHPIGALSRFLRALGVPTDAVPVDVDEAAALYRSTLVDQRVLIILDNAQDANQIRHLLPGNPRCIVVVTSRDELVGLTAREGAMHLALGVLTPDQSHDLLVKMLGKVRVDAEHEAATELAELCGHLPLALRIAAAALMARPADTIAAYAANLRGTDRLAALEVNDPEATVQRAFESSYAALPTDAQRVFRLLGLVPGPTFTAPPVAAMADVAPREAGRLLKVLTYANVVECRQGGSFALHDLVRHYAMNRAIADDSRSTLDAATRQLHQFYLSTLDAAAALLYPQQARLPTLSVLDPSVIPAHFRSRGDARAWLDAELANLLAIVGHAADHGHHPVAWHLADGLRGYFDMRVCAPDWLAAATTALRAADADNDVMAQASANLSLAHLHRRQCRWAEATTFSEKAAALARAAGWRDGEMAALHNLAATQQLVGHIGAAIRNYEEIIANSQDLGRPHTAAALGNLGIIRAEHGQLPEANEYFRQALSAFTALGARGGEAVCLAHLGETHHILGRFAEAEDYLQRALAVHQATGDRGAEAEALRCLAALYNDSGRRDVALEVADQAVILNRSTGQRRYEADALNTLAVVQLGLGQPGAASDSAGLALQLARHCDNHRAEALALISLADAGAQLGRDQSTRAVMDALHLARARTYRLVEARALTWLASRLNGQGEIEAALTHATEAHAICERVGYKLGIARSHAILAAISSRRSDLVSAEHHASKARRLFDEIGGATDETS